MKSPVTTSVKIICAALAAILLAAVCACAGGGMKTIDVNVDENGRAYCSWQAPDGAEDAIYRVSIICANGKTASRFETRGTAEPLIDRICYYLQNTGGTDITFFVRVEALNEAGKVFARGESRQVTMTGVIPADGTLTVGSDIAADDILSFTYSGSADYIQGNFGYYVYKALYGADYDYSYYADGGFRMEGEAVLSPEEWAELMSLLEGAEIERESFSDPDLQMLDGSSQTMRISWNGMTADSGYYELVLSKEAKAAVIDWLNSKATQGE